MVKYWIAFTKWFLRQSIAIQLTLLISGLIVCSGGLTYMLIENYKAQRIEDRQTIKDLNTQLAVKTAIYEANTRRTDSIHRIDLNNERLTVKAMFEQSQKERAEIMKVILNEKSKLRHNE